MALTNFIQLNMMKEQLLVIYQFYHEETEYLKDPAISKGYLSLVSVSNVDEFMQWQKILAELGLSYSNTKGLPRNYNPLGVLEDIAAGADNNTLSEFINFKSSFDPAKWNAIRVHNQELVRKICKVSERSYDVHIVLVHCGDQLVAVGDDADRLFEIFGWQTSSVFDGTKEVSYMFVSDYGYKVLMNSGYSIKRIPLGESDSGDIFLSSSFSEEMVAGYQQHVDYLRLMMREEEENTRFMLEKAMLIEPSDGYDFISRARINFMKDKVVASCDGGKEIVIAEGRSWRLDRVGQAYLLGLGSSLGQA